MEKLTRKDTSRPCQSNTATAASKKEIDERRLRKLKVYLRSVSYNSCERLPKFSTLPDLYSDTILSEEFPCDSMKLSNRHHCAPTPFLIACCFNRRYPVNARKRAGNMRRPSTKQGKKTVSTPENTLSSVAGQTSKITNKKVNSSAVMAKLRTGSTVEKETANKCGSTKIIDQDNCSENRKNERGGPEDSKGISNVKINVENKELEIPDVKEGHSGGKTRKAESVIKKTICEDKEVKSASKTSEANKLKTSKATVEKTKKIIENTQDHVCGKKEDFLANNKQDKRNEKKKFEEKEFEVGYDLENCSSKEESKPTNKGSNGERIKTVLSDHSSCHTSCEEIKPENSALEGQKIEDKSGKVSETVPSQKASIKPEIDQRDIHPEVENQKKSREQHTPPQKEKDEVDIYISPDPSRRTSARLATLCNWQITPDKEKNVQRKDAKFTEKMKLKVSGNVHTRLRSRSVIKQPGHENRYTTGRQKRGK